LLATFRWDVDASGNWNDKNNTISGSTTIAVETGARLDVIGLDTGATTDTLTLASGQTLQGNGSVSGTTVAASGSFISSGSAPFRP